MENEQCSAPVSDWDGMCLGCSPQPWLLLQTLWKPSAVIPSNGKICSESAPTPAVLSAFPVSAIPGQLLHNWSEKCFSSSTCSIFVHFKAFPPGNEQNSHKHSTQEHHPGGLDQESSSHVCYGLCHWHHSTTWSLLSHIIYLLSTQYFYCSPVIK